MGLRTGTILLLQVLLAVGAGAEEEALGRFRRAYADPSATVRRKALGILEDLPGPRASSALLPALADSSARVRERARDVMAGRVATEELAVLAREGLRHREVEVRRRSADLLLRAGEKASAFSGELEGALKDRDPLVRESAAAALGAAGHRGSAPVVAAALAREGTPEVRGALLRSLDHLDLAEAAGPAARLPGRDRDGPPCIAALEVLARRDTPAAEAAARELLRHPRWEVRLAAAGTLGALGSGPPAVEALLGALDREKRIRVRAGIAMGLERLTGAPLGEDLDRWREWWKPRARDWKPATPAGEAPPPGEPREGESTARFYDIPVDGDHVAFVLDTSKSMADPARLGEEATKMQVALAQVAKTFGSLGSDVRFNIIAFGTEVEAWRPRTVPAGSTARYEGLRFLQKRPLEGRTNIFDAMALALADEEVDTVFLLTDGAPSEGEETSRSGFLAGLAVLRRWRPVRVHCVEVGASNTGGRWKGFMADVAAACGGVHVAR